MKKVSQDAVHSVEEQVSPREIQTLVETVSDIRDMLRRHFAQEANLNRKPRQSREQRRQLSIALDAVAKDPLHNIQRAAKSAFKSHKGYKTWQALECALRRKWNYRA